MFLKRDYMTCEPAAAATIDNGAMALGAYAAQQMLHGESDAATPSDSFLWWQSYLASRLRDLASAVHLGRPRLFITQVRWCYEALAAKNIEADEFVRALKALAEVIETEVTGPGMDIAERYIRAAIEQLPGSTTQAMSALNTETKTGRLAATYILAILEGDRRHAAKLIHEAVADSLSISDAYLKVLLPASNEIGRMWHQDELSISEEHFATSTTLMVMAQLQANHTPLASNGKTVLVASVAGDHHTLGIHVASDFFEMDGWRVIFLGADVPGYDLIQAVSDFKADLLVLSATLHTHLRTMQQMIQAVREVTQPEPVPVLVGGNAFISEPDVAKQINADGYASDIQQAVEQGRRLVGLIEGA